jgi:transaldolase
VTIVEVHDLDTEVLAASIRHPRHMTDAAMLGAHIATTPFKVLQMMVHHPLTDSGITKFREDWEKARKAAESNAKAEASRHN